MSRTWLSDWTELVSIKCFTVNHQIISFIVVFQSFSRVQLLETPWKCSTPGFPSFTISRSFLKSMSVESVMPSNHLTLCHHLLFLPSIFPGVRVFSNESALCIWWLKYWSFSFSISPSNEYSVLISFRIDWFDLLAITGLSRVFFSTTVWKHHFFSAQPSLWSNSHVCTWLLEKPWPWQNISECFNKHLGIFR